MKFVLLTISLCSFLFAFNVSLSDSNVSNGKTTLLEFKKEKGVEYEKITFGKKTFKIFNHPLDKNKMYSLVPVSYYQKPSAKKIKIHYKNKKIKASKFLFLRIEDAKYEREKISVKKSKVNPKAKETKERISKEYGEAMRIYSTVTSKSQINSKFLLPMESFITSAFGKARIYNETLKGYHSGTDFRARVGTPIVSSNDGVVALVKDRFYSGGTVLIDHGHGIYTCYFHMCSFTVEAKQKVKKGQIIGLSGQSGRVTGPHLHFAVRINGVQVDPLQFIELMNKKIFKEI